MGNGLSCAYVTCHVWLRRRSITCSQCSPSGLAAKGPMSQAAGQRQPPSNGPCRQLVCLSPAQPRPRVQSRPLTSHTPLLPPRPLHCSTAASGAAQGFKKSPRSSPNRDPSQAALVKLRHFCQIMFFRGTLWANCTCRSRIPGQASEGGPVKVWLLIGQYSSTSSPT